MYVCKIKVIIELLELENYGVDVFAKLPPFSKTPCSKANLAIISEEVLTFFENLVDFVCRLFR